MNSFIRIFFTPIKGQLISKGLFGVFNSSKKQKQKKSVLRSNFFCSFFGIIEDIIKSF